MERVNILTNVGTQRNINRVDAKMIVFRFFDV